MKPTEAVLLKFLKEVDGDFYPPLSQKTDLNLFAKKILANAEFFYRQSDSGDIIGLVVIYANDWEKKYAYIPLVAVSPSYRRLGIANKLLLAALDYVASLGNKIQTIGIHTNNSVAVKLYQNIRFKSVEIENGRTYMEIKLVE